VTEVHGVAAQAELLDHLFAPEPPPRRRRWPYAVLALAVVAAAAVALVLVTRDDKPSGPPHPAKWDARVQEYVAIVEQERGLTFEHPVFVDFLSAKAFKEKVTSDDKDLTDEDREDLEQATGLLRAVGLVEGDVDLFNESNKLRGSGVLGYYSYDDERIRVRGTELTPAVRSTLVHELTHALQDQHFDLGKRFEDLEKDEDSAAADGFRALVEGDARRIEKQWREGLPEADRTALDQAEAKQVTGFEAEAADIPEVLKTLMSAPYELGEAVLAVAIQQGGEQAVDNLFRSPPSTEEQQLDPWTLIADHQGYLSVPKPELEDGDEGIDDGTFGALGLFLVLSERLPAEQALTAVDGWGGDSYAAFERDGVSCVRIHYRGDTPDDLVEMKTAMGNWVAKLPQGPARVSRDGTTVNFESCDPGANAPRVAAGKSMDALALALSRTYLSVSLVESGLDVPTGRCAADRLVREFSIAELNSPNLDQARVQRTIAPCRKPA
jgi:hypothetical protein